MHKIIAQGFRALVFIRSIDANYCLLDYLRDQKRNHCADNNLNSFLHQNCLSFLYIKQHGVNH
jgi:hypothetical protein